MNNKYTYVKIITVLLIGVLISTYLFPNTEGVLIKEKKASFNNNLENTYNLYSNGFDAELPFWEIGDRWIYDVIFTSSFSSNLIEVNFDLSMENLIMEVTQDDQDFYKLSLDVANGDFTGTFSVDSGLLDIGGDLKDAELNDSWMKVNKSDLSHLGGVLKINGIVDDGSRERDFIFHLMLVMNGLMI